MQGKERKLIRRRLVNAYLSSVISISLVLLLVGMAALLLVNTKSVSDYFKEHVNVTVMMKPDVSDGDAQKYQQEVDANEFVIGSRFVSKAEGQKEMEEALGSDFMKVFTTSPIPASIEVSLKAEYVSSDSLKMVEKVLGGSPLVEEVDYQGSLVEKLNTNLNKASAVLGIFIALLLFISFVLINNTMRLAIFDKRFSIHTMKLVGATRAFIRAPFLVKATFLGIFSSIVAILLLVGMLFVVKSEFAQLFEIFRLELLLVVMGIVLASGVLICVISTYFVVNKLVSLGRDELYF